MIVPKSKKPQKLTCVQYFWRWSPPEGRHRDPPLCLSAEPAAELSDPTAPRNEEWYCLAWLQTDRLRVIWLRLKYMKSKWEVCRPEASLTWHHKTVLQCGQEVRVGFSVVQMLLDKLKHLAGTFSFYMDLRQKTFISRLYTADVHVLMASKWNRLLKTCWYRCVLFWSNARIHFCFIIIIMIITFIYIAPLKTLLKST